MTIAPPAARPAGPLSQSQRDEVVAADTRARGVRRAAGVAGFNGWTIGVLAALSAPFALFDVWGLVLCVGMALVAFNEFRGRDGLRRFEPPAATRLGWNQVGFLTLIVIYCGWQLAAGLIGPSPFAAELAAKPELRDVLGSGEGFDAAYRLVLAGFYGVVILLSIGFQGGNAWYYFARRRLVEAYLRETPEWVVDLQRLSGGR